MNKILVSNEKPDFSFTCHHYEFRQDGSFHWEFSSLQKELYITVADQVHVVLDLFGKNAELTLHIQLGENSQLTLYQLMLESRVNVTVILDHENSIFHYYYSLLSSQKSENIIEVKHLARHTTSFLKNHGLSLQGATLSFDVNAIVEKQANGCLAKQDNQIIEMEHGLSQINPNLYIENYDVEASHSAYVGEFREQDLFYLMSRGISETEARFLLLKSFLIEVFSLPDDVQSRYTEEVMKYFHKEV